MSICDHFGICPDIQRIIEAERRGESSVELETHQRLCLTPLHSYCDLNKYFSIKDLKRVYGQVGEA